MGVSEVITGDTSWLNSLGPLDLLIIEAQGGKDQASAVSTQHPCWALPPYCH